MIVKKSCKPRNVLLIAVDTLRADHLGCYGYFRETSPTIDKLAGEGVLFPDMHASAIATGPAFTSIITGLYPIHHRCYMTPHNLFNLFNIDDRIQTLPGMVRKKGLVTCAFDGLFSFASPMKHMVRGFEYYINYALSPLPPNVIESTGSLEESVHGFLGHVPSRVPGEVINKRLLPWIKEHKKEPFFLFVHYWEPHAPYNQPEKYRRIFHHTKGNLSDLEVRKAKAGYEYVPGWGRTGELWEEEKDGVSIDLYDGEIRYLDTLIKEVLSTLKKSNILDDTLIILTADHGEQLGQHGIYGHGGLHEAVTHIPLILWGPKFIPKGRVVPGYVQQIDIVPTVLDFMGARAEGSLDGMSLFPLIEGKRNGRRKVVLEDEEERALLSGRWKYIHDYLRNTDALYNLDEDPAEVINLARKEKARKKKMKSSLDKWVRDNLSKGSSDPLPEAIKKWRNCWRQQLGEEFPTNELPIL